MLEKAGILRRNKDLEDESWDLLNGNDDAFFLKEFPDDLPRIGIDSADYGGVVILEGANPGEIMGEIEIDPRGSEAQHDEEDRQEDEKPFNVSSLSSRPHIHTVREKTISVKRKYREFPEFFRGFRCF
ncbi:MAG: hypothetical protein GTO13_06985 [Proteobacteria bacterium]|nr:hypothetical protein [Pseudomonadota bacterium]